MYLVDSYDYNLNKYAARYFIIPSIVIFLFLYNFSFNTIISRSFNDYLLNLPSLSILLPSKRKYFYFVLFQTTAHSNLLRHINI